MDHTTLELKQQLSWVTVGFILLDSIIYSLLCELILQLKSNNRQTVNEQTDVQRQTSDIRGILQLPCDAENVFLKHFLGFCIILGRSQIEHDQVCRINFHTVAQHINNATFRKLTLQSI